MLVIDIVCLVYLVVNIATPLQLIDYNIVSINILLILLLMELFCAINICAAETCDRSYSNCSDEVGEE